MRAYAPWQRTRTSPDRRSAAAIRHPRPEIKSSTTTGENTQQRTHQKYNFISIKFTYVKQGIKIIKKTTPFHTNRIWGGMQDPPADEAAAKAAQRARRRASKTLAKGAAAGPSPLASFSSVPSSSPTPAAAAASPSRSEERR